ncbi:MAG: DUF4301 family protein [Bacteroidetes bacterium]|nr:MAG: DUF4301 family protein [Bacteroidota bacterium]
MFTEKDLQDIAARGSERATVEAQIKHFETGFPFLQIRRAATVGDGILALSGEEIDRFVRLYEHYLPSLKIVKFVPASGAASRMFKALFSYLNEAEAAGQSPAPTGAVAEFFARLEDFAFYSDLKACLSEAGHDLSACLQAGDYATVLRYYLTEDGLGYGVLPKGLLQFHRYPEAGLSRTALEEHMVEAMHYATAPGGTAYLHLTVSPEHIEKFQAHVAATRSRYETEQTKLDISFSVQKPATDTIAVDMDNAPFRTEDGSLLFRPGGHGALLSNLNDIDADVIFIKNIDNVVPDGIKAETYRYKMALGGILLSYQEKIFDYLEALADPAPGLIGEVETFLQEALCVEPPAGYDNWDEAQRLTYLKGKLNRPLRVCGMVKNEGEPGGGPFWAANPDGTVSLQIAETAQIDEDNPEQRAIMQAATHFNPVDLVCATRDRKGKLFDLMPHRDPKTGFISYKSLGGRELKAQELPGLWNGSMSDWNTLFVEVPIITFNPVKTVNDLLRPTHQP